MRASLALLLHLASLAASDLSCRQSLRFVHDGLPREVKVYTPTCGADGGFANASLPLLFAVHCFGCTFAQMEHWEAEARAYGFVLVLPLESSRGSGFNAGPCCGAAMRAGVDDVGFLRAAADRVVERVREAARPPVAFGVGWSNGGFLVALDALAAARDGRPRLFRAIAPVSGHQYDLQTLARLARRCRCSCTTASTTATSTSAAAASRARPAPPAAAAPSRPCCCGIGAGAARCEGVGDVVAAYAEANRCDRGPEPARALARWFAENRSAWPPHAGGAAGRGRRGRAARGRVVPRAARLRREHDGVRARAGRRPLQPAVRTRLRSAPRTAPRSRASSRATRARSAARGAPAPAPATSLRRRARAPAAREERGSLASLSR